MVNAQQTLFLYFLAAISMNSLDASAAQNIDNPTIYDALINGKSLSQMRLRYEYVDQQNKPKDANAFTLQTLLGWQTANYLDTSITAQLINVSHLNQDFYDNSMGKSLPSQLPTVPDPDITDINQLFIDYSGIPKTKLRLGRQIIRLDNTRFVGDIVFRQVSQVLDGLTVINQAITNSEILIGHYERLRQSTGKYRATNFDIAHFSYQYLPKASVTSYGYFIDQADTGQNTGAANNAHKDLGIRFDGDINISSDWHWLHTIEYAKQSAYQNGSKAIDAYYRKLGLGLGYHQWFVRMDEEILSSNSGLYAFQTPMATAHPFQGWTDLFTTTPKQGIVDHFITVGGSMNKWIALSEWHHLSPDIRFQTPAGLGKYYGSEWDFSLAYQYTQKLQAKFEYAHFSEGDILGATSTQSTRKADMTREWVTLSYQF
jgi:hypothetical protein